MTPSKLWKSSQNRSQICKLHYLYTDDDDNNNTDNDNLYNDDDDDALLGL